MNVGIILAAGKGTRLNCTDRNKTSLAVAGKPLVAYGAELFARTLDKTIVVVGAYSDSVQAALADYEVEYAWQTEQKGTGHAVMVAVDALQALEWRPQHVCIGYGDHMMFYTPEMVLQLLEAHSNQEAAITLVTTKHSDPNALAWGRIVRNETGHVMKIVEQKDATESERAIDELNAGFYCMEYDFLEKAIAQLAPSPVTGEYYLTDLIASAQQAGKVVAAHQVPFSFVGSGINTLEQLAETDAQLGHSTEN